jgi:hypothetical protein
MAKGMQTRLARIDPVLLVALVVGFIHPGSTRTKPRRRTTRIHCSTTGWIGTAIVCP